MGEAADRYAAITRDQWNYYKRYGIPHENELLGMMDNQNTLNQNLSNATGIVNTVSGVQASEANRALSQYGIAPTAAQTSTNNRLNSLARTANMAKARDFVREKQLGLSQTILSGSPNSGLNTMGS